MSEEFKQNPKEEHETEPNTSNNIEQGLNDENSAQKVQGEESLKSQDLDFQTAPQAETVENNAVQESLDIDKSKEIVQYHAIRKKRRNRVIALVAASIIILIGAFVLLGFNDIYAWTKSTGESVDVEIPDGSSTNKIAAILQENGLIDQKNTFLIYTKLTGKQSGFLSGTYELTPGMSYNEIITDLKDPSKNIGLIKFVVPEGTSLDSIAQKLSDFDVCDADAFLDAINNPDIYEQYSFVSLLSDETIDDNFYAMEGFAFPATYTFQTNMDPNEVANTMLKTEDTKLQSVLDDINSSGMSLDETVILASIIQAEAGSVENMPYISSVLHNRLNNPAQYAKLECDPTKKYAQQIQGDLQQKGQINNDIVASYDTYQCKGLPAGAICNPGIDAIEAALQPADTDYFYFCADTQTKECYYAVTLEEHNQNLKKAGLA